MIPLTQTIAAPPPDLVCYHAQDPLLENLPVLVFYGPSTTINSTLNSSRIQAYIFSIAGSQHFPRLTVAPTSPLYAAVNHLPAELQGDEICRGLAVSLLSYFAALPSITKAILERLAGARRPNGVAPRMFDEMHAGILATSMESVENGHELVDYLRKALLSQSVSWLDVDMILPVGSIQRVTTYEEGEEAPSFDENGHPVFHYGKYDPLIRALGSPAFLPTSKLKRAPSRPPPHSKSRVLSKEAKIALRREMCELIDTESNYIARIDQLVNESALPCRRAGAWNRTGQLFPECLDQILELGVCFYKESQSILDGTEDLAIMDIECTRLNERGTPAEQVRTDPTGATMLAEAMLKWFPRFHGPYQEYLRASSDFGDIISFSISDIHSPLANMLKDIGEQKLRSALIEPVQRLPRYNLLIDNIVKLLPAAHPSLSKFLKARDIIKDICALDLSINDHSSTTSKILRKFVSNWYQHDVPNGRLLGAVDITEISSPFELSSSGNPGILLLFVDEILILTRRGQNALTAKGLMAEIERPALATQMYANTSLDSEKDLTLSATFALQSMQMTESRDGHMVHLTRTVSSDQNLPEHSSISSHATKACYLQGAYEGKAARLEQEVCMARIESRFPESIRDSGRWALRTMVDLDNINLIAAVHESQGAEPDSTPPFSSVIRVMIHSDVPESTIGRVKGQDESNLIIRIAYINEVKCSLTVEYKGEILSRRQCSSENIMAVFLKQLGTEFRLYHQDLVQQDIPFYYEVLKFLPLRRQHEPVYQRGFRPLSPVKMLSKMLSGQGSQASIFPKSRQDMATSKELPRLPPSDPPSQQLARTPSKVTVIGSQQEKNKSPLTLLEDTFIAYLVGLRAQSGNVVGKILRNRAAADELLVNELYNTLLEDPSRVYMAAERTPDVVFAAFEKFLRRAWREGMGPLLSPSAVQRMQSSLDAGNPTTFASDVKSVLEELSPQNRRAFASTIKLLSELLDASGSDGDRGALIASFAEALILVGEPHEYINLLDRLVDDWENLFEDAVERIGSSGSASSSTSRNRSFTKGSYNSNNSSFRKRFGFGSGLSRETSKTDAESKVASILRSWGKAARPMAEIEANTSTPKISLIRSKSTDTDPRTLPYSSIFSPARPTSSGSTYSAQGSVSHGTAGNNASLQVSSMADNPRKSGNTLKKKRRSSLSDLTKIQDAESSEFRSPLQPRNLNLMDNTSPPTRSTRPQNLTANRENAPPTSGSPTKKKRPSPQPSSINGAYKASSEDVTISSPFGRAIGVKQNLGGSPSKGGLTESAWPPNDRSTSLRKTGGDSPRKLRVQSPQKIRDKLNKEQNAWASSTGGLQAEIDQIGKEMSVLKVHSPPESPGKNKPTSLSMLSTRLDALSTSLQALKDQHVTTTNGLRHDLDNTLTVAEKRAQDLEELYKEANAENEVLYERFNDELGRMLGKIKKGEGVDEMRGKLAEALKEISVLKSEKTRLKKELLGLRSQMID